MDAAEKWSLIRACVVSDEHFRERERESERVFLFIKDFKKKLIPIIFTKF